MKRILVGVDGSPESRKAAEYASQLARATHSALELAFVLPEIAYSPSGPYLTPQRWQEARTDRAQLLLYEMSQSVPDPLTAVDTALLEGSPAHRLAAEAKRDEIWLVVVGHRGRGSVERVLLGSVADRLTQLSSKPVLVVR
ncbi:MAG TPA: universal stress protein [Myxococcales bacterium]|jgi:nucleotide-binding universal stress UspA family protein